MFLGHPSDKPSSESQVYQLVVFSALTSNENLSDYDTGSTETMTLAINALSLGMSAHRPRSLRIGRNSTPL